MGKQQHSLSTCYSVLGLWMVYNNTTPKLIMVTHLILDFHIFTWHEDLSVQEIFEIIVMETLFRKSFSRFWFTFSVFQSYKNLNSDSSKGIWRCKKYSSLFKDTVIIPLYKTKLNFTTVLSFYWFVFLYKNISLRIFSQICLVWRWLEAIRLYYDCESSIFILFYTVGDHCLEGKIWFHWSQCRDLNTRTEISKGLSSCNSVSQ